jgi:uncharacterized protein (TIGR03435 family)
LGAGNFVARRAYTAGKDAFTLTYTPEDAPSAPGPDSGTLADSAVGPSLLSALQEQLGLKLEARKAPVEILVVDHAEKLPTET